MPSFMWVALRAEIDWIKHTWCISCGDFHGKMAKTPTTQPFSFIFVAMVFFSNNNSTPLKIFQNGAVGELVWTICGKKWPARHSKLSTRANLAISKFYIYGQSKESYFILCKYWSLPVMAPMLNPHFKNTLFLAQSAPSGNLPGEQPVILLDRMPFVLQSCYLEIHGTLYPVPVVVWLEAQTTHMELPWMVQEHLHNYFAKCWYYFLGSWTPLLLGASCVSVVSSPYNSTGFVLHCASTILWLNATAPLPKKYYMLICGSAPGLMIAGFHTFSQPWLAWFKITWPQPSYGHHDPYNEAYGGDVGSENEEWGNLEEAEVGLDQSHRDWQERMHPYGEEEGEEGEEQGIGRWPAWAWAQA